MNNQIATFAGLSLRDYMPKIGPRIVRYDRKDGSEAWALMGEGRLYIRSYRTRERAEAALETVLRTAAELAR